MQCQHPGLNAGHIEQSWSRVASVGPTQFRLSWWRQCTVVDREKFGPTRQRRGRDLDGGEWRAQVVGHRTKSPRRKRSASSRSLERRACSRSCARSRASAASLAKVLSTARSVSGLGSRAWRGCRRAVPTPRGRSCAVRWSLRRRTHAHRQPRVGVELVQLLGAEWLPGAWPRRPGRHLRASSSETPGTSKMVRAVATMFLRSSSTGLVARPTVRRLPRRGASLRAALGLDACGVQHDRRPGPPAA